MSNNWFNYLSSEPGPTEGLNQSFWLHHRSLARRIDFRNRVHLITHYQIFRSHNTWANFIEGNVSPERLSWLNSE